MAAPCFKITYLDDNGNFTLGKGSTTYRLSYHHTYNGGSQFPATPELLDMAYYHLGNSDKLRDLDDRSEEDIMHARGIRPGLNIHLGDSGAAINVGPGGPSLSYGSLRMTVGGGGGGSLSDLQVGTLRNICNKNGLSCRAKDGRLLTKQKLINKLERQ